MTTASIIMVDDEEDLREPVAEYLREQGLDVREANGGPALDRLLADGVPQLFVLDVTMPGEDGFSIARRLRATYGEGVGIVMLTARRDLIDRVVGLELGADDYIMKPFEPRELLARIRSVLRRLSAPLPEPATAPAAMPDAGGGGGEYQREFWVQTSRGAVCVPVETIEWIQAAKDYALLHTAERSHIVRVTMGALEKGLDPAVMMRVHRSAFVRLGAVRDLNQIGTHATLLLETGRAVRVSPRYVEELRARIGGGGGQRAA